MDRSTTQSYAICKSDLLAKGHDATNIAFGNTLTDDAFKGRHFDFCMSNPPFRKMSACCGIVCCCEAERGDARVAAGLCAA